MFNDKCLDINKQPEFAITAHYIETENVKLCLNLLGCIEYDERHISVNLYTFLKYEMSK